MSHGRVAVGHPVDVGSGAMFTMSTDFRLPGVVALRWQRHYSTIATGDSWLGIKWIVPYFMCLERRSNQYVLRGSHGQEIPFAAPAGQLHVGAALANFTANMELRREAQHYSILHWHAHGEISRFCFQAQDGNPLPLAWIDDRSGNRLRVEYDPKSRPVRLVQELERRTVEITYDRNDLISAVHYLGKTARKQLARYEYDSGRRLLSAWDAMGHRKSYEYDRDNRMTGEINPLGSKFVFEYDRQGRCIRTAGSDGYMERKLQYHTSRRMTRVTDSQGAVTEYHLNPAGQVAQVVRPLGGVTTNTFDEHGRLVEVMHPDGSKENYVYDDQGNLTTTVDRCGARTTVEHDEQHMPTRVIDRNGHGWIVANS
jgi:YD repeat-containing protein